MTSWTKQTVLEKKRWTDTLFSLKTTTDGRGFIAGQFTKLGFQVAGEETLITRAYSYVNAPWQDYLEFYYVLVPGGSASHFFDGLTTGDELLVQEQSHGFMTLAELPQDTCYSDLWLLATGTGVGPFLSILRDMLHAQEQHKRFRRIALVHAARHQEELAYSAEIVSMQKQMPQLRYQQIVSQDPATTHCLKGRIPALIASGALEESVGHQLATHHSQVMLCGNPAMIKETTALLQERGLTKNRRSALGNITTEQYWVEK